MRRTEAMDDTRSLGFHRSPSDLTVEERRIVIHSNCWNDDGLLIRHTDIVTKWHLASPEKPHPDYPELSQRDALLLGAVMLSSKRRWAWDALNRLLAGLMDRGEPIPKLLDDWVRAAHTGRADEPAKIRNPDFAPRDDRNLRIWRAYRWLRNGGWSKRRAYAEIGTALDEPPETIRTVCRRVPETFR